MSYYYLVSPYTKFPLGIEAAWYLACEESARLIAAGLPVYSPIAHGHAISVHGGCLIDEHDWKRWIELDEIVIAQSRGVIILRAESWKLSDGIRHERDIANDLKKPIIWMTPGLIPFELQRVKMLDAVTND